MNNAYVNVLWGHAPQCKDGDIRGVSGQELEELIRETNVEMDQLRRVYQDDDGKVIISAVVGSGAMSGTRPDVDHDELVSTAELRHVMSDVGENLTDEDINVYHLSVTGFE